MSFKSYHGISMIEYHPYIGQGQSFLRFAGEKAGCVRKGMTDEQRTEKANGLLPWLQNSLLINYSILKV